MKRFFIPLLSFVVLLSSTIYAQKKDRIEHLPNFDKKNLRFGYYLGLNKKGFKIDYNTSNGIITNPNFRGFEDYVIVQESIGFNIGLVVDYKLYENINLRFEPGLSSNTKKLTFDADVVGQNGINNSGNVREISGTYLRFPLLLKFSTNRLHNMRAFVIGGFSYDYNFSSNQNNTNDNLSGEFRMKTSNFMYEVGLGVDLYLPYFKFSPSIRGIFAINNELVPDNLNGSLYTGSIDYLGTRGIFLNLTFQ